MGTDLYQPHELLVTKLHVPHCPVDILSRNNINELLLQLTDHNLILVSAPAGFGKSVLIADWVRKKSRLVAWYSIDSNDNDPNTFLSYLIASLQQIDQSIGQTAGTMLLEVRLDITKVLISLINDLCTQKNVFNIILDDYHLIDAPAIHSAVEFLAKHLPEQGQIIIITRSDPPLPLASWRARGQLGEIRADQLRFSDKEAGFFLQHLLNQSVANTDVHIINGRTEGWVTGLRMVAAAFKGRNNLDRQIHDFGDDNRFILDYLFEEVFRCQDTETQEFLLKTAILSRFSPGLCDYVFEGSNSRETLDRLEQDNLFIVALDDTREWYRYHHLFASLLQNRLYKSFPGDVEQLHCLAGRWLESEAYFSEAIDHYLAAGEFKRAVDLIENIVDEKVRRSEIATIVKWVDLVPDEMMRDYPRLCVYHAMALLMGGKPLVIVRGRIDLLEDNVLRSDVRGEILMLESLIAAYQQDSKKSIEYGEEALTLLKPEQTVLRSIIAGSLGLAYMYAGKWPAAERVLQEAARISRSAGNLMNYVLAQCHLGGLRLMKCDTYGASKIYEAAIAAATDQAGNHLPVAGIAMLNLGFLYLEWCQFERAGAIFQEGIELARRWGEIGIMKGYIGQALVHQAHGDFQQAWKEFRVVEEIARRFDAMDIDDFWLELYQARLAIKTGDLAFATDWARSRNLESAVNSRQMLGEKDSRQYVVFLREMEFLTLAQLYLKQKRRTEALEIIDQLAASCRAQVNDWSLLEVLVFQSIAHHELGDNTRAVNSLVEAMNLAARGNILYVFFNNRIQVVPILKLVERSEKYHQINQEYYQELNRILSQDNDINLTGKAVSRLSKRELDVLRLIAQGLSNAGIGEQLYISLNTVKTHLKNIFSKLEVMNRTAAVEQARKYNLLQ